MLKVVIVQRVGDNEVLDVCSQIKIAKDCQKLWKENGVDTTLCVHMLQKGMRKYNGG